MTELSNWGKWGKDDQAGTISLITPAVDVPVNRQSLRVPGATCGPVNPIATF
jgi:hypothetical protein